MATHSIWSKKPFLLTDGNSNTQYNTFRSGKAAGVWTELTSNGYFNVVAKPKGGGIYEFILVAIGISDDESIIGLWDVIHDGTVVCNRCVGRAYGLDQPIGNYFKIYIGDDLCYKERWHYSGYITNRFDF